MYKIKFVALLITNNLLFGHILIPPIVFETQGFKKSQKTPPSLILGKYSSDCAVHHLLSIFSQNEYIKRISSLLKVFL